MFLRERQLRCWHRQSTCFAYVFFDLMPEQERYGSFSQGIGLKIENGTCSLEECEVSGLCRRSGKTFSNICRL